MVLKIESVSTLSLPGEEGGDYLKRHSIEANQEFINWNPPPRKGGEYRPMSFGWKIRKGGRERRKMGQKKDARQKITGKLKLIW